MYFFSLEKVQNKLMDEQTIANSRQFPFSFFSAFEVIPRDMAHYQELLDKANDIDNEHRKEVHRSGVMTSSLTLSLSL